jgi:ATP-dependent Lhr-like helicase
LKQGRLRAVVSSATLELGIDVGTVNGVVFVHPPGAAIRLLQRIGRAGHSPGALRRGLILISSPADLLQATVTVAASRSGQWESLQLPCHPLDVLCQQLVGMAALRSWSKVEALELVRRAYPYRELSAHDFESCLEYLSGRRADGRSWLPARLRYDGTEFAIIDRPTARLLIRNLGTIVAEDGVCVRQDLGNSKVPSPDGLELTVRAQEPRQVPVGQIDESFAERLKPGDLFLLDSRCLEVKSIESGQVRTVEVTGRPAVPRWAGEGWPLSSELAARLYVFRMRAAEALRDGVDSAMNLFCQDYGLDQRAALVLANYFLGQESESEIPDSRTCLVEKVQNVFGSEFYVHTPLNRAGNDALARVLVRRLCRDYGWSATSVVSDLGFMLNIATAPTPEQWQALFAPAGFEKDFEEATLDCLSTRSSFQRVAQIGLMVLRNPRGRRRRVGGKNWAGRRLFDRLLTDSSNFVLLEQARREVRQQCDVAAAGWFLAQLPQSAWKFRSLARVSPFAASWTQSIAGHHESIYSPDEVLKQLHAALMEAQPA